MLRPSVAPGRASHGSGSVNSHEYAAAAAQRLAEKKKEYEAVAALESASNLLLERMAGISEDFDVMADAGRVHGQVLEQWPKMFQILSLFVSQRQQTEASPEEYPPVSSNFEGQRLVRVPIDELASDKH